jgi:hypothetical protein
MVNLRQVAPVVNPAFQALSSVQVVLILECGGCVYNPNAPARFDMGFILLMVLSAYYLIRRKRRFTH